MIDRATVDALARISQRSQDLLQAYEPGFEPLASDAARNNAPTPNADPLSVAAPEGAYFLSRDRDGNARYSRDGGFSFVRGELVDAHGAPALGFSDGSKRGGLGPVKIDQVDIALGRVQNERIEADGSVVYDRTTIDPRTGTGKVERVVVGRLALARFPAGSSPVRLDASHVEAPRGVTPTIGVAADGTFGSIATFSRDVGRLDLAAGLQRLQEAYQSFEAMRAAHSARGDLDKTTMDLVK